MGACFAFPSSTNPEFFNQKHRLCAFRVNVRAERSGQQDGVIENHCIFVGGGAITRGICRRRMEENRREEVYQTDYEMDIWLMEKRWKSFWLWYLDGLGVATWQEVLTVSHVGTSTVYVTFGKTTALWRGLLFAKSLTERLGTGSDSMARHGFSRYFTN